MRILLLFLSLSCAAQVVPPQNPSGYTCGNGFHIVGAAKVHVVVPYAGVPAAYPQEMSLSLDLKAGDRIAIFGCGFKGGEYLKFWNNDTGQLTKVPTIFISSTRIDAVMPDSLAKVVWAAPKQKVLSAKK